MKKLNRREPIFTTDTDGEAVVLVPLANHDEPAKVFHDDFVRLIVTGCSDQWTLNRSSADYRYVRVANSNVAGNLESVSRLIVEVGKGTIVRYRDGNHLNLRRDNLYTTKGYAKGQTLKEELLDAA